jgi:hypothetical protein
MTPQRKQEIAALLERAFAQSLGSAASIRMGQLKETLVGMSPGFDEGRLGFRSFASFLKAFPTVVTLDRYRDDVRPVGTDVPSATSPEVVPIVDTETAAPGPVEPVSAAVALAETEAKEAVIRKSARRATAKKDTAKKDTAKKDTAKKDTAKKDTAKKTTAKKTTAKKTTAKKTTAKKDTAKKDTAKKDTPKKASAQKAPDPASDR